MNRTHFEHAAYALLMQGFLFLTTGNAWIGAAFGAAFFIGREHAQAESRVGAWAKYPEFEAFAPRYWNLDSMFDWIVPGAAVVAVALAL